MEGYRTDEEQVEAVKEWWQENGKSIVFGVVLGLGGVFGWRAWQNHMITQAEQASNSYDELVSTLRGPDPAEAREAAQRILERHPKTAYAIFADMILARLEVNAGNLDAAAAHLRAALDSSDDAALDKEIRLRLARVLVAQDQPDEALGVIDIAEAGEFSARYDELRGDIELARGKPEAAREAYERALAAARTAGADTALLEDKLANLSYLGGS